MYSHIETCIRSTEVGEILFGDKATKVLLEHLEALLGIDITKSCGGRLASAR